MIRRVIPIVVVLFLAAVASAQTDVVSYPLAPHFFPDEGTIECWVRLENEPAEPTHHFPIWAIVKDGEPNARALFGYTTVWSPKNFHLLFYSYGKMSGQLSCNGYIASVDETQEISKGDYGGKYPRTPRFTKGEWHHIALTWSGGRSQSVSLYVDGNVSIRPSPLVAAMWDDLENFKLILRGYVYETITIDDLRISRVARTEAEIKDAAAAGTVKADRFTLLLDRFESLEKRGDRTYTTPEVFAGGLDQPGGLVLSPTMAKLVEGKTGKGLKIVYR